MSDGTTVSLGDRNQTSGTIRGRIGYELSPALIPFIEAQCRQDGTMTRALIRAGYPALGG